MPHAWPASLGEQPTKQDRNVGVSGLDQDAARRGQLLFLPLDINLGINSQKNIFKNVLLCERTEELVNMDESKGFLSVCPFYWATFTLAFMNPEKGYSSPNQRCCHSLHCFWRPLVCSSLAYCHTEGDGAQAPRNPAAPPPAPAGPCTVCPCPRPWAVSVQAPAVSGPVRRGWLAASTPVHLGPCGAHPTGDSLPRG